MCDEYVSRKKNRLSLKYYRIFLSSFSLSMCVKKKYRDTIIGLLGRIGGKFVRDFRAIVSIFLYPPSIIETIY